MFVFWYWFSNSWVDYVNFLTTAGAFGFNALMWFITAFLTKFEGARAFYFWISFICSWVIILVWPAALGYHIYDATVNEANYSSMSYAVVKILLFSFYTIIFWFMFLETLWPMYDWWQILARLANKKPYTRPTEEEVAANDVIQSSSSAEDSFFDF